MNPADDSRPIIAINPLFDPGDRPAMRLHLAYADAILRAGGLPFVMPPIGGPADQARMLSACDGLLLTGGDDFAMERFGQGPTHPSAQPTPGEKLEFDLSLVRQALDAELPILGICYGMQLLGLMDGATLHQHLPEDRPECGEHRNSEVHGVTPVKDSKLAGILGVARLDVVSRHHQALATVDGPWRIAAVDDGGLIEATEHIDHPFALGVQWHPELSPQGSPHDRLFQSLVSAAGIRSARCNQPISSAEYA